jgi:hypothetical protein
MNGGDLISAFLFFYLVVQAKGQYPIILFNTRYYNFIMCVVVLCVQAQSLPYWQIDTGLCL